MTKFLNVIKTIFYPIIGFVLAYCQRNIDEITILGILILFDFITGILKSGVLNGGSSITSQRAKIGLLSKLLLLLVPLTVGLVFTGLGIEATKFVSFIAGMLIVSEGYSIVGNILSILSRKEMVEFDAITFTLKIVLNKLKQILEKNLK